MASLIAEPCIRTGQKMVNEKDCPESDQLVDLARRIEAQVNSGTSLPQGCLTTDKTKAKEQIPQRIEKALSYLKSVRLEIRKSDDEFVAGNTFSSGNTQVDRQQAADFDESSQAIEKDLPKYLGRFEILRVLGQGGFARVLLARDPQLNRLVALKVPRPTLLMAPGAKARFEREAQAAAILSHPNIVPVFESGTIGPISYIASGYCCGTTLEQWFSKRNRDLDLFEAVAIVSRLADAVQHAHARGVVHRDLKPANVLVELPESDEFAASNITEVIRITDFGLASVSSNQDQMLTSEGAIVGTPAYMSPEQATGQQPIGLASDIYSLGVILYELMTGELPLLGKTQVATLQKVTSELPMWPSKHRQSIPAELDAICMKCLNKEPLQRYRSAFHLTVDLQNWLENRPVSARPISAARKFWLMCLRNPKTSTAVGFAVIFLCLGLGLTTWKWLESNSNLKIAESEKERSIQSLYFAQKLVDQLVNNVVTDPNSDIEKRVVFARQSVNLEEQLLKNAKGDERVVVAAASAHCRLGELLFLGKFQISEADQEYGRARELLLSLPEASEIRKTNLAFLDTLEARLNVYRNSENDNVIVNREATDSDQIHRAHLHFESGRAQYKNGDYSSAIEQLAIGLDCLPENSESDPFLADIKGRMLRLSADCNGRLGRYELAERQVAAAIDIFSHIRSRIGGHPEFEELMAMCFAVRGSVRATQQKWHAAIEDYREAQATYVDLQNSDPNDERITRQLLLYNRRLAETLQLDGQTDSAIQELKAILDPLYDRLDQTSTKSGFVILQAAKNQILLAQLLKAQGSKLYQNAVIRSETLLVCLSELDPENNSIADLTEMLRQVSDRSNKVASQ